MVIAILLIAQQVRATVHFDGLHPQELTVLVAGRTFQSKSCIEADRPPQTADRVKFGGREYSAEGHTLIEQGSGRSVDVMRVSKELLPKVPEAWDIGVHVLRSKGGIALEGRMLWLFSWDNTDLSMEPSAYVLVLEIKVGDKGPFVARSFVTSSLGPYVWHATVMSKGARTALIAYGLSLIDTDEWKEVRALTNGQVAVAAQDRIYWSRNGVYYKFDIVTGEIKGLGNTGFGDMRGAFDLGDDDLLVFERGLATANTRAYYQLPGSSQADLSSLFVVKGVGVGIVSGAFPPDEPGLFLTGKYLKPSCIIKRG